MEMVAALLVVYVCLRFIHGFQSRGPSEHCYYDKFEPRCDDDEVILIINALYGRMKFGRCVKTNFGFIGCYDDVTHLLQERCLTRRGCSVEVVEPTFPGLKPCNVELKSYLEVEYACVKELVPDDPTSCDLRLDLNVAALTPDVIATSSVFGGVTCGNGQSPFRIKVEQGQRINVSMVTLQSKAEAENVNRKRSIFIGHDYVTEYRENDDEDDDDDMNSHSSSYYDGGARDEYDDYNDDGDDNDDDYDDDDGHDEEEGDADLESDDVITAKVIDGLFHHGGAQSLSGIESPSTSSTSSSSPSSSSSSSSTTTSSSSASFSLPSVVTTLNESSLVPPSSSSSSSSSSQSSVATWRSASPRTAFITSSSVTSSSTASSSMTSSPASFSPSNLFPSQSSSSSGETIRSRDRGRRTRRSHQPPPLRRHLPLHQISKRLSDLSASPPCRQMGRIVEPRAPQVTSELCGGRGNKLHHVISSQSNSLEIYLEERRERFMLLFGVIGCPDIRVDQSTTRIAYARDRATAEVTCLLRHQTWLITCRDNRWIGFVEGNCSGLEPRQYARIHPRDSAMEFFEDASKSPGVLRSIRLNSVLVVVIVTGVSGAISLFVLAVGLLIFKRFRSRVNHIGESELIKYPISLTEIAYPSSPLDELDGKSRYPLLANGQTVQPRCACRLSGNHRPESCEANQELGSKIFSLEIPTANLSEFSTWGDKMDTSHAITSPTSRCHGRDGSPLCIECLANERKPLGLSPLDLAPISTKQ